MDNTLAHGGGPPIVVTYHIDVRIRKKEVVDRFQILAVC